MYFTYLPTFIKLTGKMAMQHLVWQKCEIYNIRPNNFNHSWDILPFVFKRNILYVYVCGGVDKNF